MSDNGDSEENTVSPVGRYKIEIVIKRDGINEHIIRRLNELPYTAKYLEKDYEVKVEALFEVERGLLRTVADSVFLVKKHYMIVFREGENNPLMRSDSEISPRVLKVARTSTAVKGMIKEWFSGKGFGLNKWVFIIITAGIGTIIYAKMSGMI